MCPTLPVHPCDQVLVPMLATREDRELLANPLGGMPLPKYEFFQVGSG